MGDDDLAPLSVMRVIDAVKKRAAAGEVERQAADAMMKGGVPLHEATDLAPFVVGALTARELDTWTVLVRDGMDPVTAIDSARALD